MSDTHIPVYHGHVVAIRYTLTDKGYLIGFSQDQTDPVCPLQAVKEIITSLKNGGAVGFDVIREKAPGLMEYLNANNFAVTGRDSLHVLLRQIKNVHDLYDDLLEFEAHVAANPVTERYVAVIKASAVRDAQYDSLEDSDPMSEAWTDCPEAEIFIGIFSGNEEAVRRQASEYADTSLANVRLIRI